MNYIETMDLLRLYARTDERVVVAFEIDARAHKVEGTMSVDQARIAINIAADLGATRFSIFRHER